MKETVDATAAALIGMIPEGLYLLTSVALAVSMMRLARRGGYSLGGLAAVYSLYSSYLPLTCIFSICGSFWYPDFIDFCREHTLMQSQSLIYLQNGQTEGANHSNRLSKAPIFARNIHDLISEAVPSTYSTFDAYGHHEALDQRYHHFCDWLREEWNLT